MKTITEVKKQIQEIVESVGICDDDKTTKSAERKVKHLRQMVFIMENYQNREQLECFMAQLERKLNLLDNHKKFEEWQKHQLPGELYKMKNIRSFYDKEMDLKKYRNQIRIIKDILN